MKTLEDLRKLREKVQAETNLRYSATTKVVVGMGTCGIAAGAREVMLKFIEKIAELNIEDVVVQQTGCVKEVIVDIIRTGEPKITYARVTPADVENILKEHVIANKIVENLVFAKE